jgi:hypothetical protein
MCPADAGQVMHSLVPGHAHCGQGETVQQQLQAMHHMRAGLSGRASLSQLKHQNMQGLDHHQQQEQLQQLTAAAQLPVCHSMLAW